MRGPGATAGVTQPARSFIKTFEGGPPDPDRDSERVQARTAGVQHAALHAQGQQ